MTSLMTGEPDYHSPADDEKLHRKFESAMTKDTLLQTQTAMTKDTLLQTQTAMTDKTILLQTQTQTLKPNVLTQRLS